MKNIFLSILIVVLCSTVFADSNLEAAKALMKHGFRLIENENMLMVKSNADSLHPFIRIEKLPAHFILPEPEKMHYLESLEDMAAQYMTLMEKQKSVKDSATVSNMFDKFMQLENTIRTAYQHTYKFDCDVNFDGIPDVWISPVFEYLDPVNNYNSVRYFYKNIDHKKRISMQVKQRNSVALFDSPILPLFDEAEYNCHNCFSAPKTEHLSSFTREIYSGDPLTLSVSRIRLIPQKDGNIMFMLISANPEEKPISFSTHFNWEE